MTGSMVDNLFQSHSNQLPRLIKKSVQWTVLSQPWLLKRHRISSVLLLQRQLLQRHRTVSVLLLMLAMALCCCLCWFWCCPLLWTATLQRAQGNNGVTSHLADTNLGHGWQYA